MIRLLSAASAMLLLILPRTDYRDAASLGGRVTNENNVAIGGAMISARNKFSGEVERIKSDTTGEYNLAALRQGRYSAFAQAEGFGSVWVPDVVLFSGKHTRLDFKLTASDKKVRATGCDDYVRSTK